MVHTMDGETISQIRADILGDTPRGPWAHIDDALWTDWRWQHRNRLRKVEDLEKVIMLTDSERDAIAQTSEAFRMAITPYYAVLMHPTDPNCPIRKQAVPTLEELDHGAVELTDPLGEEAYMPVPGITHRYPDRVLFYVSHHCPVYCRHCTRKRKVSDPSTAASHRQIEAGLEYIRTHPEVRDVLVSGGDPLTLSDQRLDALLGELRAIPHVEIIRLCTRNPVTLPSRFTPALIERLRKHQPLLIHTHFNHPAECTPEAARCLRQLADAGLNVANQMVLLKGINDRAEPVRDVNHWLLRQRCRPYYLFQADLALGTQHFRASLETGLEILKSLRGFTSGMAVPHYVIDAPGGGGKIPLVPEYIESAENGVLRFKNYLGEEYTYPLT